MSRCAAVAVIVAAAFACASPARAPAQQDPKKLDFGAAYSFAEREPRTVLETTIDRLLPSIVKVHGASGLATITSYATGIVVSEQGHILTLDQVLVQRDRTRVVLYDGSIHDAKVLPSDDRLGVILLQIDASAAKGKLHPLWPPAGDAPYYRTGQCVVSIGNCFRLAEFSEKVSATFGVVVGRANTALRYRLADVKYDGELILTDACNNPGHYGGGLFDLQGNWLGLNARLLESKETNTMLSVAIPSRDLLPYLEERIHGKVHRDEETKVVPVWTGIVLFESGGRQSPPAYVDRVERPSPAADAGLRPDDLVVRIDDYAIRSCKELRDVLTKYRPGQTVQLTYKRGTTVEVVPLVLAEEKR